METGPILSLSQFEFADQRLSSSSTSLRIGFSGIGSSCADLRQLFHYDERGREKEGGLMIAIFVPFHGKISISPKIYRPLPPSRTEINERRSKSCCSPRFRDLIISQWFVPFNFLELTATFGTIAISAKKKKYILPKSNRLEYECSSAMNIQNIQ